MNKSILCYMFADIRSSSPELPYTELLMPQNPTTGLCSEPFGCFLLRLILFFQLCLISHYHSIYSKHIIPFHIHLGTLV